MGDGVHDCAVEACVLRARSVQDHDDVAHAELGFAAVGGSGDQVDPTRRVLTLDGGPVSAQPTFTG